MYVNLYSLFSGLLYCTTAQEGPYALFFSYDSMAAQEQKTDEIFVWLYCYLSDRIFRLIVFLVL